MWPGKLCVRKIDWKRGVLRLNPHEVECEIPELRREAIVEFIGLPSSLSGVPPGEQLEILRKRVEKERGAELLRLDRQKHSYSVKVNFSK